MKMWANSMAVRRVAYSQSAWLSATMNPHADASRYSNPKPSREFFQINVDLISGYFHDAQTNIPARTVKLAVHTRKRG
ncbi:hypothetical protein BMS3Bbin04_00829 [bacterium BMS3Bbin04]|nr:hypothetical protein BMS3Bbin04_00829 [bacterium BMS3Bbin04]